MNFPRFKHWTSLIIRFLAGQGSVQLLNLISGFLLLRWLSVEAYAQYSVAFGFQSMIGILVDLGFSGSIIALVGDRLHNKEIVGTYIRAAKHFRNRLFAFIIPLAVVAFPLFTFKQNWNWLTQLLLIISIVSSLFFQGWISYYSAPLLINQRLKEYYQPQIMAAGGRLVLCYVLYLSSILFSWTTAWVNAAVIAVNGSLYRSAAKSLITEPFQSDPKVNREMVNYLLPLIPGIVFMAFQGQISVFLITWFGQNKSIAEVAALGRLGQIFMIFSAFNSVVVEPYIAKVARQNLAKRYFQILGAALVISISLSIISFLFPQPFLWVLGPKYHHLQAEIGWMVSGSCLSYIGGVMWTMHSARKWIYWWGSFLYIILLMATQIICVAVMDLSTTINVIYFSFITTCIVMLVHIIGAIYGFTYGPRRSLNT